MTRKAEVANVPFQICVSGAAKGSTVTHAHELASAVGRRIAELGHITLTGATSGLPDYAAAAARKAGGVSVGFSPAASRRAHIKSYHLPVNNYDTMLYTGFDYTGRDLLLVRSADAVVTVGGRIGTIQEFAAAFENRTPIGVLTGSGGVADAIPALMKAAKRSRATVIYDDDPARLVDRLVAILHKSYELQGD